MEMGVENMLPSYRSTIPADIIAVRMVSNIDIFLHCVQHLMGCIPFFLAQIKYSFPMVPGND